MKSVTSELSQSRHGLRQHLRLAHNNDASTHTLHPEAFPFLVPFWNKTEAGEGRWANLHSSILINSFARAPSPPTAPMAGANDSA